MDSLETTELVRQEFFGLLWQNRTGWMSIAWQSEANRIAKRNWNEKSFFWPDQADEVLAQIDRVEHGNHVWFTPLLYDNDRSPTVRAKDNVSYADIVWCDMEEVHPDSVTPKPPIVIQSSPGRYQAIWRLQVDDEKSSDSSTEDGQTGLPAQVCSEYSRRIAHQYKHLGADTSGADLAQLFRVPGTFNYKKEYADAAGDPPVVSVVSVKDLRTPSVLFESMPPSPQGDGDATYEDMPDLLDADDVIERHRRKLNREWFELYGNVPDSDWSKVLWRFMLRSFEAGMDKQEVFSVAVESACNKFKRDGYRPNMSLWWDVLRAFDKHDELHKLTARFSNDPIDIPMLYDPDELSGRDTFISRYHTWAAGLGDAAPQYHELCGTVILSALLCGNLRLDASYGTIIPNVWGMILADTTLTRKSTAMDHATDLLESVPGFEDIVLATDGSMEGIFKSMSKRSGMPSIFKRDEVQGFMASVGKKDYMAGMLEGLTKLYDSRTLKRQLAKESITVYNPRFIILGGGTKSKMFSLLSNEHIETGFLPRFLFVAAEGDVDTMKPTGPKTDDALKVQYELRNELTVLKEAYVDQRAVGIGSQATMMIPETAAVLTQAAWERNAKFEKDLMTAGTKSQEPALFMPMLSRFGTSTLKIATLLAAQRQEPKDDKITVEAFDIADAIALTSQWIPHLLELMENIGKSVFEGDLQKVYGYIKKNGRVPQGAVMRQYRLSAREMRNMMETLEGRGLIDVEAQGKARFLTAIGL